MAVAFVFPGQGSQSVGMGHKLAQEFASARVVFDEVDEALGEKLSQTLWAGPESELTLTANAQPALMAVSLAVMAVLREEFGLDLARDVKFVAGHSLGEYSALAAAGTFSIADAARLLRIRGRAMQAATPVGIGAMAAVLGLDYSQVVTIALSAAQGEVCNAANDNSAGQVVISGHKAAVERACELAKQQGAKRCVMLPVSAPFHCALMAPAAEAMAQALSEVTLRSPVVPVVSNVTARPTDIVEDIRKHLIAQVTGTVRWRDSIAFMAAHDVNLFCEVGAGKVLTGLMKKNASTALALSLDEPNGLLPAMTKIKEYAHV